eukprot:6196087-Pleurochrysis_carterae.AAC.1
MKAPAMQFACSGRAVGPRVLLPQLHQPCRWIAAGRSPMGKLPFATLGAAGPCIGGSLQSPPFSVPARSAMGGADEGIPAIGKALYIDGPSGTMHHQLGILASMLPRVGSVGFFRPFIRTATPEEDHAITLLRYAVCSRPLLSSLGEHELGSSSSERRYFDSRE